MEVVASAPARIDLAGGFTDGVWDDVGGVVVNIAIDLRTTVKVSPSSNREEVEVSIKKDDGVESIFLSAESSYGGWWDLFLAAVKRYDLKGLKIETTSDIPWGSGLGGSGSTGVALVAALSKFVSSLKVDLFTNEALECVAKEARALETEEMSASCGWQDQWAAAFGGINFFTASKKNPQIPVRVPLNLDVEKINLLQSSLTLIKTPSSQQRNSSTIQRQIKIDDEKRSYLEHLRELAEEIRVILEGRNLDIERLGRKVEAGWGWILSLSEGGSLSEEIRTLESHLSYFKEVFGWKACGAGGSGACVVVVHKPEFKIDLKPLGEGFKIIPFRIEKSGVIVASS